jgi:hypothetical protein
LHSRATFFAGTSQPELEVPAQISRCASGAGGRTCQSGAARMGWRVVLVWCPLPMLLLALSERGTEHFSLGLSLDLEAEEKMWWGVGRV